MGLKLLESDASIAVARAATPTRTQSRNGPGYGLPMRAAPPHGGPRRIHPAPIVGPLDEIARIWIRGGSGRSKQGRGNKRTRASGVSAGALPRFMTGEWRTVDVYARKKDLRARDFKEETVEWENARAHFPCNTLPSLPAEIMSEKFHREQFLLALPQGPKRHPRKTARA